MTGDSAPAIRQVLRTDAAAAFFLDHRALRALVRACDKSEAVGMDEDFPGHGSILRPGLTRRACRR